MGDNEKAGFAGFERCPVDEHYCTTGAVEGRCCCNLEPTIFEWGSQAYEHLEEHLAVRSRLLLRRVRFSFERVQQGESRGLQYRERIVHGPWWAAVANLHSGVALFLAWFPEPGTRWEGYALSRARRYWDEVLHPPEPRDAALARIEHDAES